jgi:hypothetical protein
MTSYRYTPLSVSIHPSDQNPYYGNGLRLSIVDEGGGAFLEIEAVDAALAPKTLRLDLEELEQLVVAARRLLKAYERHEPPADPQPLP